MYANRTEAQKTIAAQIIERIKEENSKYEEVMAKHECNEVILKILREFDLNDDANEIIDAIGMDSLEEIRDAENGIY